MKKSNSALLFIVIALSIVLISLLVYFLTKKTNGNDEKRENPAKIIKASGLDKDKKVNDVEGVEEVVAKWIEANPQAIINAVSNMQQKGMEEQMKNAQKNIGAKKDELFSDKKSPQFAPSGYDITVVEFYDYACGYCKKVQSTVEELLKEDKKVRIIYRDFPILGQPSKEMAEISVAVNLMEPSSFKKFHDALMSSDERGKDGALKIAKNTGISISELESTLSKDRSKIEKILGDNLTLGSSIGINGTPAFIIGEELISGALDLKALKEKISAVRKKG